VASHTPLAPANLWHLQIEPRAIYYPTCHKVLNESMNSICLRRLQKVILEPGVSALPTPALAALIRNIASLGYVPSLELIDVVKTLSIEQATQFHTQLSTELAKLVGAHVRYQPFYPNFPQQVMQAGAAELYVNALLHYLTGLRPESSAKPRGALKEPFPEKQIGLASVAELEAEFCRLCNSTTSISSTDADDLRACIALWGDDVERLLPHIIEHKEVFATAAAALMKHTQSAPRFLARHRCSATDVLRLAVALCGGDVSLASACKFKNLSRAVRKQLLALLETGGASLEDLQRYRERWLRLGELLHPGEFAVQFPNTYASFVALRAHQKARGFQSVVSAHLADARAVQALQLLRTRPGELVRRVDHLLRITHEQEHAVIFAALSDTAQHVATPVLLQLEAHFKQRAHVKPEGALRVFFPKGKLAKAFAISNAQPALPIVSCQRVLDIVAQTLVQRFSTRAPLGASFLAPELSDYCVPFSQRSAAKTLRTIARGSKLALPDADTLRFFLWWKNGKTRTDIDLSAVYFDAQFRYLDVVSYYNIKNFGGHHSGDIVDAPNGAAEFIDVSKQKLRNHKVRYVILCINAYTEQRYCDLPECFAGWMARKHPDSGEIFEPKTVQDRIDLSSDTGICLPAMFDVVNNQVIWLDMALSAKPKWNNVENNLSGISIIVRALSNLPKPKLSDLFAHHIKARGHRVDSIAQAQTTFSLDQGITPFDLTEISAHWL
jgi:hypothetical protein